MSRITATLIIASACAVSRPWSRTNRPHRPGQERVRSTTHLRGSTRKPFTSALRGTVRAAENAVTDYHDLMNARLRQFEHLVAGELPVLRADLGLDVAACRGLDEYVRGLRYRIVGQFDFHRRTARYRPEEQRHQPAVARRAPLWPVPAGSPSPGSPSPGSVPAGFVPPGVPRLPVHRMG